MGIFEAKVILKKHFLALDPDDQDAIAAELEMPDYVTIAADDETFWRNLVSACTRTDKMADLWDMVETQTRGGRPLPNPWL